MREMSDFAFLVTLMYDFESQCFAFRAGISGSNNKLPSGISDYGI